MDKNIVIAVVLAALVLISGVQAFQLNAIKEKVTSGELTGLATTGYNNQGSQQQSAPARTSAPTMVGGC